LIAGGNAILTPLCLVCMENREWNTQGARHENDRAARGCKARAGKGTAFFGPSRYEVERGRSRIVA
jgi:hypothetical protein